MEASLFSPLINVNAIHNLCHSTVSAFTLEGPALQQTTADMQLHQ